MSLDGLALAGERHVDEVLIALQVAQRGHDVALEVVPLQGIVFMGHNERVPCIENENGWSKYFFFLLKYRFFFGYLKASVLTWFLEFFWLASLREFV